MKLHQRSFFHFPSTRDHTSCAAIMYRCNVRNDVATGEVFRLTLEILPIKSLAAHATMSDHQHHSKHHAKLNTTPKIEKTTTNGFLKRGSSSSCTESEAGLRMYGRRSPSSQRFLKIWSNMWIFWKSGNRCFPCSKASFARASYSKIQKRPHDPAFLASPPVSHKPLEKKNGHCFIDVLRSRQNSNEGVVAINFAQFALQCILNEFQVNPSVIEF